MGVALWYITGTVVGFGSERTGRMWPFNFIGGWASLSGPYEVVGTYNVGTSGVSSVEVDWVAGEIVLRPHDGNDIQITEFAQRELQEHERLSYGISDGTLSIWFAEHNIVSTKRMPLKRLEVLIPRGLSGSLDRLSVDSTSGAIDIDGFVADSLSADSTSGAVSVSNTTARELELDSTSGAVAVTSVHAEEIEIDTSSGSIRVSDTTALNIDLDTTSGSINVSGVFKNVHLNSTSGSVILDSATPISALDAGSTSGSLKLSGSFDSVEVSTVSGSISFRSSTVPSSLSASSTSGSVTIAVPSEGALAVEHSSVSGRFSSEIPVVMQGSDARFEISTTSGNTRIIEY